MWSFLRRRWLAIITLIVFSGTALAGFIYLRALNQELNSGDKQAIVQQTKPELGIKAKKELPGLKKATTYLLLGSDARPGDSTSRTDTILIVRVYPGKDLVSVLSLPRDLWVPIPGYGSNRINAAYAFGGVPLLTKTIREWSGVPIDHFFVVDFSSFARLVDSLGGLYLPIDQDYYHFNDGQAINNWSSIDVDHGYQKLPGPDALSWVRFRHRDSDFHRAARQQIFIREAGRQIRQGSFSDFQKIAKTISRGTTSDLQLPGILKLGQTVRNLPPEKIVRFTMPGSGTTINGASVLLVNDQEKREILQQWSDPQKILSRQRQGRKTPATPLGAVGLLQRLLQPSWPASSAALNDAQRWLQEERQVVKARPAGKQERTDQLVANPLPGPRPRGGCRPEKTPSGYSWSKYGLRSYRLQGYKTQSAYATRGSGESILFTWSAWPQPPILERPGDALRIDGRKLLLYWEGPTLRIVAWKNGPGWAWVNNTLLNNLSYQEMIAIARGCR